MRARQRVGLTRWVGPLPLRSKLTVQAGFVHPSRFLAAGPTERQFQALFNHAELLGVIGQRPPGLRASAVWTKAEAAMRTAPTVAILRPPEQSIPDGVEP